MPGLAPHQQEVGQLLAGVNDHGPGEADERVDWEEEALLLVRSGPEDEEPEEERGLGQRLGQVEPAGAGAHLPPEQVLGAQQDWQSYQSQQEDDVEVEEPVDQIELGWLRAVEVRTVGGEDVIEDDVEAGEDRFAVVVAITEQLGGEDGEGGDDRPSGEQSVLTSEYQDVHSYGHT